MLRVLLVVAAGSALYALYLEVQRGRGFWKLVEWLKAERPTEWEGAQGIGRRGNIEDAVAKLRRGRLTADDEFLSRHDATTRGGRSKLIALTVAGSAIVLLLAGITVFDWSF